MQGHFTSAATVGIAPFKGNSVIIYIIEPDNFGAFQSNVSIQKLEAGFQNMEDVGETGSNQTFRASVNCDPTVQCQQDKILYARATARFVSNGFQGTGTLLNNENNSGRAFFLTAFHVLDVNRNIFNRPVGNGVLDPDEIAALAGATFQFQFWRTQCNSTVNNNFIQFTGAVVRAAWPNTDVVLLELTNPAGIGDLVNYAGWNRQTNPPADYGSFIIHHPHGEDMRVTNTSKVNNWLWNNMYLTAHYSSGTVERGSSGSALFNQYGQVVGQLRSGWSSCNYTDFGDRYGKFTHSWNGAGFQASLSPNQGLNSVGLLDLTNIQMQGPDFLQCTNAQPYSTLAGLEGVTYQWIVSSGLQVTGGQGTPTAIIAGRANASSAQSITVILRSPNKGRNRSYTITKYVNVNSGAVIGWYNSPTNSAQPMQPSSRFELNWNDACYTQYINTNMQIAQASTVVLEDAGNSGGVAWSQSGNNLNFYFSDLNQYAYFRINVSNTCGTQSILYRFRSVSDGCSGGGVILLTVNPNPSTGDTKVALTGKGKPENKKDIRQIRILDKSGMVRRQYNYGAGVKNPIVNTSGLSPDVYTIMAHDGDKWTAAKLVVK